MLGGHIRGRLGSSRSEESYGGQNLALVLTVEAHQGKYCSYKEVPKQPTALAPTQNRRGLVDLLANRVSGTMKEQRTSGPTIAQLKGGGGIMHDENLAKGGVCHMPWEMKMHLANLQEKFNSKCRRKGNGHIFGLLGQWPRGNKQ